MASRFEVRKVETEQERTDSCLYEISWMNEFPYSASQWGHREQDRDQEDFLRENLLAMHEHVSRLQDILRSERAKCSRLQLRCNQQEAELRHRELHANRLKERLSLLTDRQREKAPSIEVLNSPPGGRAKREQPIKPVRTPAEYVHRHPGMWASTRRVLTLRLLHLHSRQHTALQVMLERREAEQREAMKLRHSLTTLLHALRVDMEQTLLDSVDVTEDKSLDQAEGALGEHVTGGVVQSWREVQKKLQQLLSEGQAAGGTDQDKLLAQLQTELRETQQLVGSQQQLLQDGLDSPLPSELADSYFLEELERLRMRWAEFGHQKRTFERERRSFTDAAIRLGRERLDFEQQKAFLMKQQFLTETPSSIRRETTGSNSSSLDTNSTSGSLPMTPLITESDIAGSAAGANVRAPTTPEILSALGLHYKRREVAHQSDLLDNTTNGTIYSPEAANSNWSF